MTDIQMYQTDRCYGRKTDVDVLDRQTYVLDRQIQWKTNRCIKQTDAMTDMQMNYTTDAMTKQQVYWTEKHMYNTDVQTDLLDRQTDLLDRQTDLLDRQTDLPERQTDLLDRQTDLPERLIQLQTNRITRYRQMNAQCVHYRK